MMIQKKRGRRRFTVICKLCQSGLNIWREEDLKKHDEIWHKKNRIDYFDKLE